MDIIVVSMNGRMLMTRMAQDVMEARFLYPVRAVDMEHGQDAHTVGVAGMQVC